MSELYPVSFPLNRALVLLLILVYFFKSHVKFDQGALLRVFFRRPVLQYLYKEYIGDFLEYFLKNIYSRIVNP